MEEKMNHDELERWLYRISENFYEKAFAHPWLSKVFFGVDEKFITQQQTDFMIGAFGGPKRYIGRNPGDAHTHIFINEDMWQTREQILKSSFQELSTPQWIQDKWLKIDEAFKNKIVMKSSSECVRRFPTDDLIIIDNPLHKKAA